MFKRCGVVLITGIALTFFLSIPASAQQEITIGGGWWSMPDVESVSDSGLYASLIMGSETYQLELDYGVDDLNFMALAADYLYSLSGSGYEMGSSAYIGVGYTYFSSDDLDNANGLNVMLAADLGEAIGGQVRYDFLGGDQDMFTIGITYQFR